LGCALCGVTDDPNYAAYGGRWQRFERSHGRVGSRFAEAGADTLQEASEVEVVPEGEPGPPQPGDDEITGDREHPTKLATFIE